MKNERHSSVKEKKKATNIFTFNFLDSFVSCLIYSDKLQEEKADTHRR